MIAPQCKSTSVHSPTRGYPTLRNAVAVSIALILLLSFCAALDAHAQSVSIISPQTGALFQQADGTAAVTASVDASGLPAAGGVEFVLDAGCYAWRTETDFLPPYSCTFYGVTPGEHTLDAFPVDSTGARLGPPDSRYRIGVGDVIVAMGDSITAGLYDDYPADNWSSDGRTGPWVDGATGTEYGGFAPVLADMLSAERGYPVMVVNRGVPGDKSDAAAMKADGVAREYPSARTWILGYGTNDAGSKVPPSVLRENLETAIRKIRAVNPAAEFFIPKILCNQKHDATIIEYHNRIGDITRNVAGVRWGADLDSLFRGNHMLYDHMTNQPGTWFAPVASHHPNGLGVRAMAALWQMAMVDTAILVTDGVTSGVGHTWADQLRIDGMNSVGLNAANMLQVRTRSPAGMPPPGTAFLCPWAHDLHLTSAQGFAPGSSLTATVRVEVDALLRGGGSRWSQVWLSSGSLLLPTDRTVNPRNARNYDLSATVRDAGQIACVIDTTAPVSAHRVDPASPGPLRAWYVTPPQVFLSASDSTGLPVDSIRYRWDSGSTQTYSGPLTAPRGVHTVYYHAVDQSGNAEQDKSVTVMVMSAPSTPIVSDNAGYVEPNSRVNVSWRVEDPGSGVCQYHLAVGTRAGLDDLQAWTNMGQATSFSWQIGRMPSGSSVFFSVKAYSADWQCSPIGCSDGVAVLGTKVSLARAKALADGTIVSVSKVVVTAVFGGDVYVQASDRSAGTVVRGAMGLSLGSIATIVGRMATVDGQRAIEDAAIVSISPSVAPRPVSLKVSSLRLDSDERRSSTFGLLAMVRGQVTATGDTWFRISDGSSGARRAVFVDARALARVPAPGSKVMLTGVCSCRHEDRVWRPAIRPRGDSDLVTVRR